MSPNGPVARRSIIALGLIAIAGCTARSAQQALRAPEPMWPKVPPTDGEAAGTGGAGQTGGAGHASAGGDAGAGTGTGTGTGDGAGAGQGAGAGAGQTAGAGQGASSGPGASPGSGATATTSAGVNRELKSGPVPFAFSRQSWARGAPVVAKLDPMLPPRWITVHHDGMKPFLSEGEYETKARLESIRNGHLQRDEGWGDIGYHFCIDRAGRVWEGRSLRYQGAHVKWCNENNVGVLCIGNFEEQQPSAAQLASLEKTLMAIRSYYRIPVARVRTHREWPTARTQCPGASLQAHMVALRRGGGALAGA